MKNELESYLDRGGNYQPNFGWSPLNLQEQNNKMKLIDLVFNQKIQAVEQGWKIM